MKKGCFFYFLGTKGEIQPQAQNQIQNAPIILVSTGSISFRMFYLSIIGEPLVCVFLKKDVASLVTNWKKTRSVCRKPLRSHFLSISTLALLSLVPTIEPEQVRTIVDISIAVVVGVGMIAVAAVLLAKHRR